MNAERRVRALLEAAKVEINGPNPWDPQIHNRDFSLECGLKAQLALGRPIWTTGGTVKGSMSFLTG